MSNTSVQIEGADNVVRAYQHKKIAPWSISYGKEIFFSYAGNSMDDGAQELDQVLDMMDNSKALYKLNVYLAKDLKDGVIRSNTPNIGGFNFRLNLDPVGGAGYAGIGRIDRGLADEIKALREENKKILERLELQEADGEEISGVAWVNTAKEIMTIPGVAEIVSGVVSQFFKQPAGQPVAIAGPPALDPAPPELEEIQQDELQAAMYAYAAIRSDLPNALEVLQQLATVATTKPGTLAKVVPMLSTFLK